MSLLTPLSSLPIDRLFFRYMMLSGSSQTVCRRRRVYCGSYKLLTNGLCASSIHHRIYMNLEDCDVNFSLAYIITLRYFLHSCCKHKSSWRSFTTMGYLVLQNQCCLFTLSLSNVNALTSRKTLRDFSICHCCVYAQSFVPIQPC